MPDAPVETPRETPRHRAPALWLVVAGIVVACVVAVTRDARTAGLVLAVVLLAGAVARVIGGDRRPEGLAVRSVWVDTLVLALLGAGTAVLSFSPNV